MMKEEQGETVAFASRPTGRCIRRSTRWSLSGEFGQRVRHFAYCGLVLPFNLCPLYQLPALQNDLERVDTFIRKGKKNATDNFGYTALHFACRAGHVQVAELLLRNGVDVESRTRSGGVTSLQKAASGGRLEVVRLLVEDWGADVRAQDVDGKTGLHKATEGSYAAVVKYFLERDRTLMDVADHRYETPFALAERMKGNSGAGEEVWKLFERDVGL